MNADYNKANRSNYFFTWENQLFDRLSSRAARSSVALPTDAEKSTVFRQDGGYVAPRYVSIAMPKFLCLLAG
jgi:hypothetical protein